MRHVLPMEGLGMIWPIFGSEQKNTDPQIQVRGITIFELLAWDSRSKHKYAPKKTSKDTKPPKGENSGNPQVILKINGF